MREIAHTGAVGIAHARSMHSVLGVPMHSPQNTVGHDIHDQKY